ncbi:hypothetical protein LLE81_00115 [Staphylococcus epidermidis]|nr:hypothetical protein [Staphylococcus epidermidis]
MHHLTTLNLPTPSSKDADRQWLAAMLEAAGGEQVVDVIQIEPRPLVSRQWRADDMTIITQARREEQTRKALRKSGRPHGSIADDSALVQRATAMAALGLSRYAAARALKIGCDRLDRIAARYHLTFKKSA